MKTLIFATSFAFAGLLSYGWINNTDQKSASHNQIYKIASQDTIPRSGDSMRSKRTGRDSMNRKDTSWPRRDSSGR